MEVSEDVLKLNPGIVEVLKATPASKYHNVKSEIDGLTFQSGKEAARCHELMMLEQAHHIFALRFQVRFPLPGKSSYIADAVYCQLGLNGTREELTVVVEEIKGTWTQTARLKRKLFEEKYGVQIEEV